jgi:hypothetical protein
MHLPCSTPDNTIRLLVRTYFGYCSADIFVYFSVSNLGMWTPGFRESIIVPCLLSFQRLATSASHVPVEQKTIDPTLAAKKVVRNTEGNGTPPLYFDQFMPS